MRDCRIRLFGSRVRCVAVDRVDDPRPSHFFQRFWTSVRYLSMALKFPVIPKCPKCPRSYWHKALCCSAIERCRFFRHHAFIRAIARVKRLLAVFCFTTQKPFLDFAQ